MKSDIEIALKCKMAHIEDTAKLIGLGKNEIESHGKYIAKINLSAYEKRKNKKDGELILVTTINPTPYGEGKTTTTIGLAQALRKIKKKAIVAIREPSLGPTMGIKGGAAGGGYSQVLPMEDINLHFTGDMYMIGATHNLLAAMVDNHIYFGNKLLLNTKNILWNRVVDMNDRALRNITLKYSAKGGSASGGKDIERNASFDITAASEVMAVLCLSMNIPDLKNRLSKIIVGFSVEGTPITASDLKADKAMALLLKEAIKPNLVQTIEGCPAFVHGGPFANIAHGCSSLISTKLALKLADYVVTEAGFGSDLGAEKFFDIKCRTGALNPSAALLVVTTKSLKWQGGIEKDKWKEKNEGALKRGFANLKKHIEGLQNYNVPVLAAINKYEFDSNEEIKIIQDKCAEYGIESAVSDVRESGGSGGIDMANKIVKLIKSNQKTFKLLYDDEAPIERKIGIIARKIYGADDVIFSEDAKKDLEIIRDLGYDNLPVCVAKTQFSLSDDPRKTGAPQNFTIAVKKLKIAAGAGFVVAYTGDIMTMPGLPLHPAAEYMDIDESGRIQGIF